MFSVSTSAIVPTSIEFALSLVLSTYALIDIEIAFVVISKLGSVVIVPYASMVARPAPKPPGICSSSVLISKNILSPKPK